MQLGTFLLLITNASRPKVDVLRSRFPRIDRGAISGRGQAWENLLNTLADATVSGDVVAKPAIPAPALLSAMLRASTRVSDLIFSPGGMPHIEVSGQLVPVRITGLPPLSNDDTRRIAEELIAGNQQALTALREQGSCDISYSLPGQCRFRVNIFMQRGSHAIVMRVIPQTIPTFAELKLPPQLAEIANLKNGIVLITGPTGSGKSSTMAAVPDRINETKAYHIITIEDPVEFLHRHKRSIIHQRELHSDTPSFSLALRAALRQAHPAHHRCLKNVERVIGVFPMAEQPVIPNRLAKSFRFIISQRLLPARDGKSRVAALEILKSTLRTREYLEKGDQEGKTLLDVMRDGDTEGMLHFDGRIEQLIRAGTVQLDTGLAYATNPGNRRLQLADIAGEPLAEEPKPLPPQKSEREPELVIE